MDMHTQIHSTFHTYFYLCALLLRNKNNNKDYGENLQYFWQKKICIEK